MQSDYSRLQTYINNYVDSRLDKTRKLFELKSEYWDDETLQKHIQEEIHKASCELVILHEKNPLLHVISEYTDLKNVLWESTFIEFVPLSVRKKYANANSVSMNYEELNQNIAIYDDIIPYFSEIISTIYLTTYIAFLQSNLRQAKAIEKISDEKSDFEAHFIPAQIELLTRCINEVHMFSEVISEKTMNDIFTCALSKPLKTRNNRLLVYFFSALDDRSLITRNWQSVIDKNRLFLSSRKGTPLTQTDLSSANLEIKESFPKGSEIIDKCLKELKKH